MRTFEESKALVIQWVTYEQPLSRTQLMRYMRGIESARQVYAAVIQDGAIHEYGSGRRGSPCFVRPGSAPSTPDQSKLFYSVMPFITDNTEHAWKAFFDQGASRLEWNLNPRDELIKLLESYKPVRPY